MWLPAIRKGSLVTLAGCKGRPSWSKEKEPTNHIMWLTGARGMVLESLTAWVWVALEPEHFVLQLPWISSWESCWCPTVRFCSLWAFYMHPLPYHTGRGLLHCSTEVNKTHHHFNAFISKLRILDSAILLTVAGHASRRWPSTTIQYSSHWLVWYFVGSIKLKKKALLITYWI